MVNVIAPIFTSPQGMFLQTIYHPFRLYAEHMQGFALDVHVTCATHELNVADGAPARIVEQMAGMGPFKLLDVAASCDAVGRSVTLAVVNRDREHTLATTVQLAEGAVLPGGTVYEINGPTVDTVNSFENPQAITVVERRLELGGKSFVYTFPAHSVTLLRLQVA
jgi:alpha-L-arabinofuranosidase